MPKITENKLEVTGKSGTSYKFMIYPIDTEFKEVGGIYIFTRRYKYKFRDGYGHDPIYCGRTKDLSTRFDNHHKEDEIDKENANCICIMIVNAEEERISIEKDILTDNDFTCNEVLN